jgi:uncharacterized protein (TIGR00730 family)
MNIVPDGVAVFGSSEPRPGDPLYEQAYEVGRLLAEAGQRVVNGAYGGVMEAASKGAAEAGGRSLGVACSIFATRDPNPYLSEVVESSELLTRTRELIDRSAGFVVLHGKAGTLAELALLWALHRAGCLDRRPVVLLGERWPGLLAHLGRENLVDPAQLQLNTVVETPAQAVAAICRALGAT